MQINGDIRINMNEFTMLGIRMNPFTMSDTVDFIKNRIDMNKFTQHVVVNVAKLINMQDDLELRAAVLSCDIINIDGMGVVWGARFLGYAVPERVAGIDLFYQLLDYAQCSGNSVYFLGAKELVVNEAVANIKKQYPLLKIAGYHHGYFAKDEEAAVVEKVRVSGAKLLFVAISSPMKEQFINCWRERLGVKFVMGVGGTFDIVAGVTKRAPLWMQKIGLEWLFRLVQEPRRMWRRYLVTNYRFVILLLRNRYRGAACG